jgi:hypothetical protein
MVERLESGATMLSGDLDEQDKAAIDIRLARSHIIVDLGLNLSYIRIIGM